MGQYLRFQPTYGSCAAQFSEAAEHAESYERGRTGIGWACALAFEERVRLSTGGELKRSALGKEEHVDGTVWVSTEPVVSSERPTKGFISYHEGSDAHATPEGYSVTVQVNPALFERILVLATSKQLPSVSIVIPDNAPGMKMGWEPDGSGHEWDTKNHTVLEITSASFSFPIIADEPEVSPPKPEPLAVVHQVLVKIAQRQGWLLAAVIALCLLTYFKR